MCRACCASASWQRRWRTSRRISQPLFFGDEVDVEVVVARAGKTSVTFGHRIRKGGQVASVGVTSHVFVDGRTFQPVTVPDTLRRLLQE